MSISIRQPKYAVIENVIREKIFASEILPGDRLPPEQVLSKDFNVSLITIKTALTSLAEQGLIKRIAGKGTFVSGTIEPRDQVELIGGIDDFLRIARSSKAKILKRQLMRVPPRICEVLDVNSSDSVYVIEVVRSLENKPYFWALEYLPQKIGEKVIEQDLENTIIFDALHNLCKIRIQRVEQIIQAGLADSKLFNLLDVEVGSPIFFIKRSYYDEKQQAVFYLEGKYVGNRYAFRVCYEHGDRRMKSCRI